MEESLLCQAMFIRNIGNADAIKPPLSKEFSGRRQKLIAGCGCQDGLLENSCSLDTYQPVSQIPTGR